MCTLPQISVKRIETLQQVDAKIGLRTRKRQAHAHARASSCTWRAVEWKPYASVQFYCLAESITLNYVDAAWLFYLRITCVCSSATVLDQFIWPCSDGDIFSVLRLHSIAAGTNRSVLHAEETVNCLNILNKRCREVARLSWLNNCLKFWPFKYFSILIFKFYFEFSEM